MDPLTAVGLASNVVQFVMFASDLISKGNEILHSVDGALVENLELEAITYSLREMGDNLTFPSAKPSASERELRKLCDGAKALANELLEVLKALKVSNGEYRSWKTFRQALKSVVGDARVEQLSARLERFQKQMHTALLMSLRYFML
jgi:hypothetical protein